MENRVALLKRASLIALVGNAALAAIKLLTGWLGGSLAVLGDGIDSSTDVVISVMTLVTAGIVGKPGDKEHPYGHARAETIATTILAFIVFFAGGQLLFGAVSGIVSGVEPELPSRLALYVTGISVLGKIGLAWSQEHYGKKSGSAMLIANAKNMRGDVVTSLSVLVGLGLTFILGVPLLDRVAAVLVALWILKNAVGIFRDANTELMDGSEDHGPYAAVFEAVASVGGAVNPHRTRIRRLGAELMVDLDIEVDPQMSVAAAHGVAQEVEAAIKARLPEVYDVIVHVEPRGNCEEGEKFGLKPEGREKGE